MSFIYDNPIKIYFKDLSDVSNDPSKTILGIAYGSENDELVEIAIDRNAWLMLSDLERSALLFHELSHDILNASHVKEVDGHLMHPTSHYTNVNELINGLIGIFVEYREGTIRKFNENTLY